MMATIRVWNCLALEKFVVICCCLVWQVEAVGRSHEQPLLKYFVKSMETPSLDNSVSSQMRLTTKIKRL